MEYSLKLSNFFLYIILSILSMKTMIRITIAVLIMAVFPAAGWSQDTKISKKTERLQQKKERKEQKNQAKIEALNKLVLEGDGMAQLELGYYYFYGKGVPKDLSRAGELFRLAALQEIPGAMYNYSQCLYYGIGMKMDRAESERLNLRWESLNSKLTRINHKQQEPSFIWLIDLRGNMKS